MRAVSRLLMAVSVLAVAQGCVPQTSKFPLTRYMGQYEPSVVTNLTELPDLILTAASSHLDQRLGPEFASSLQFTGGELVEFEDLYGVEPRMREAKWAVPKYRLFFSFRNREAGIREFRAEMELGPDGQIISAIDLPEIALDPKKAHFVSWRTVRSAAWARGFVGSDVQLRFSEEFDSIVWRFERWDNRSLKYLDVSAHTGEVLDAWGAVPIY